MRKIILSIKKEECEDTCSIPLPLVPNVEKGIEKIDYDEKTGKTEIIYNETVLSEDQVRKKLRKMGYVVR